MKKTDLFFQKKKIKYKLIYKSSATKKKIYADLGTIEKDSSGFFGKHKKITILSSDIYINVISN